MYKTSSTKVSKSITATFPWWAHTKFAHHHQFFLENKKLSLKLLMHAQIGIIGLIIGSIGCNVGAKMIICMYYIDIVHAYIADV